MAVTTLCPKCSQVVAVPNGADAAAEVRCPLCQAEYPLAEAMHESAPELIVLGAAETVAAEVADLGAGSPATLPDEALLQDEPFNADMVEGESPELDFSFVPMDDVSGPGDDTADTDATAEQVESAAAEFSSADELMEDSAVESQTEDESVDDTHDGAAETSVGTTVAGRPSTKKKKRRGPGMLGQFIGIAVFGVIGLIMGYLILKWMKNPAAAEIDSHIASVLPFWGSSAPAPTAPSEDGGIVAPGSFVENSSKPPAEKQPEMQPPPKTPVVEQEPAVPQDPPPTPPVIAPEPPAEVPFTGRVAVQSVTPPELQAALAAAKEAVASQTQDVTGDEFKTLCDLGHAVALVENPAEPKVGELRRTAAVMLANASAANRREKVGYYAYVWLFDDRRPADRPGVWMVGRVEKIGTLQTAQGNLVETRIAVRGKEKTATVSVLSVERPDFRVGDTAGVLGTIVIDPSTQLSWYTGDQPRVVLSGVALGLPGK